MKVIYYFSVVCFVVSAILHTSTFIGINPQQFFPQIWILHILIFLIIIPVIYLTNKFSKNCANSLHYNKNDVMKKATRNATTWMKNLLKILMIYAIFNFVFTIFVLKEGGGPHIINGKQGLYSHGKFIRELTDKEYKIHQAYDVRLFSGHWMYFYAYAAIIIYSSIKEKSHNRSESFVELSED